MDAISILLYTFKYERRVFFYGKKTIQFISSNVGLLGHLEHRESILWHQSEIQLDNDALGSTLFLYFCLSDPTIS